MDKEDIESTMTQILKEIDSFHNEPTYDKAYMLDQKITIFRFIIGEKNFLPLHYFRTAHEEVIKYMDKYEKEHNTNKGNNK